MERDRIGTYRRWAKLRVHQLLLGSLFKEGIQQQYVIIENGLPPDACIVDVSMEDTGDIVVMIIESRDYELVNIDIDELPELPPPHAQMARIV